MAASLTLEQAWAIAERTNPALRAAQARLDAAVGERTDSQSLLFNNPALSTEAGRRRIRDGSDSGDASDWAVGIAQTFELFGQRDARREAAQRAAAAVQTDIEEAHRALRAEVERRFVAVLALQEAIDLEERAVGLIDATAAIVRKRATSWRDCARSWWPPVRRSHPCCSFPRTNCRWLQEYWTRLPAHIRCRSCSTRWTGGLRCAPMTCACKRPGTGSTWNARRAIRT
jgi:hypothetical protein